MTIFVFGDTGGHAKQLFASLRSLGIIIDHDNQIFTIPEDVTIIHLGDLIHKGPSSKLLLEVVDKLIRNNPGHWIQILGNHEFQHIKGAPYFWQCDCDIEDVKIINFWWLEGLAKATFGLDNIIPPNLEISASPKFLANNTSWFFCHGGLTYYWWEALGCLTTAYEASEAFNELPVKEVTLPGALLGMPQFRAGPVWAIGNDEVWSSWKDNNVIPPFSQIHGHTTSYLWVQNRWFVNSRQFINFKNNTKINPELKAVITDLGNRNLMVGIDPGYSKIAVGSAQPYVTLHQTSLYPN